jgi:hypothetical protein
LILTGIRIISSIVEGAVSERKTSIRIDYREAPMFGDAG